MELGSMVATGVKALAFAALNRFDTLNSLVNRMTGGSINRDTLAQKVMRDAVHMTLAMQIPQGLADRQATIVPLLGKIVHGNTQEEVSASIKELADVLTTFDNSPANDIAANAGRLAATGLASIAAQHFKETHVMEKVLHTMLKQHGWTPLDRYMDSMLTALPFGKGFVTSLSKDLLQRAILDKPEFDRSQSLEYRLLAAEAHASITDQNYSKPLASYFLQGAKTDTPVALNSAAKAGLSIADTTIRTSRVLAKGVTDVTENLQKEEYSKALLNTGTTLFYASATLAHGVLHDVTPALTDATGDIVKVSGKAALATVVYFAPAAMTGASMAYQGATSFYQGTKQWIDQTQHALVGPPASQNVQDAYAKDILQAKASPNEALISLPIADARTSDSQWIDALAKQQTIVQAAAPDMLLTSSEHQAKMEQAFQKAPIDSARKDALVDLTDRFSADQIAPFGMLATSLQAAHYLSGNLAKMTSESQAEFALTDSTARAMGTAIAATPLKESSKGGYKVADAYAQHVGKLALDFPEGVYSNAEAGLDAAKAASNYTLGSWGYQDVNATDWAELRKLYNSCDGNEQMTLKVSSYLDPAMASLALAAPVLGELDPKNTGLLQLPTGLQLQLTDTTPQYQYQLRRDGENVLLTINAAWDITQYGTDGEQLRSPQGSLPSQLKSSLTITVSPNGTVTHSTPALQCAIRNELNFTTNGALEKYTPVDVKTPESDQVSWGPVGLSQAATAVAS